LFVKDELKADANSEGRNFLSDNMNVFSWLIRERSSPTKWNHEALFPVLIIIRYLQSTKVKLIKNCGLPQIILTYYHFSCQHAQNDTTMCTMNQYSPWQQPLYSGRN